MRVRALRAARGRSPGAARSRPGIGPLLCWAVVFADIGTSVYYTPGILFGQFGKHAALFVGMTLVVFVLLTVKYAEVATRYPEGGGVVTVGAHAVNSFVGLLGGLLILVDYFLTSALSALSGFIYLSVVFPQLGGGAVPLTVVALILLGGLNLLGARADARVTAMIAGVALVSQVAVVIAVLTHFGIGEAAGAIRQVGQGPPLGAVALVTGFAGAFLAFSGLESISQLAPAMRTPQRSTAPRTMVIVVITVVATSPLLTLWATTLLDVKNRNPNQFISLLGGASAGPWLQTEVAATAALLLVFASNTAIIGCYHVFLALSRMRFLPQLIQRRNRWRETPHIAILIATAVPAMVVILANGNVSLLGDMYAFGLLGAFSVTSVCLDVVRWRERSHRDVGKRRAHGPSAVHTSAVMFATGVVTSFLVVVAWLTNLFAKPLATLFGGSVTLAGLGVVGLTYSIRRRRGVPALVPVVHRLAHLPHLRHGHPAVLVLLDRCSPAEAEAIAGLAIADVAHRDLVLAYVGDPQVHGARGHVLEIVDPYLADQPAHDVFRAVQRLTGPTARQRHRHCIYLSGDDRTAAVRELIEGLRPASILALRSHGHLLDGVPPGRRRRRTRNGVHITEWTGTVTAA
ncbi:MAG: APC family permease [Candidatus Dormibacteria bacterium]